MLKLFEKYPADEIAQEELNHFQAVAALGIGKQRAAVLLRETAEKLEQS